VVVVVVMMVVVLVVVLMRIIREDKVFSAIDIKRGKPSFPITC